MHHRIQLIQLNGPALCIRRTPFNQKSLYLHILRLKQQHAFAFLAITSGPPCLLIVGLHITRHLPMDHNRTLGLSIPIPKALVATMTRISSKRNFSCASARSWSLKSAVIFGCCKSLTGSNHHKPLPLLCVLPYIRYQTDQDAVPNNREGISVCPFRHD